MVAAVVRMLSVVIPMELLPAVVETAKRGSTASHMQEAVAAVKVVEVDSGVRVVMVVVAAEATLVMHR